MNQLAGIYHWGGRADRVHLHLRDGVLARGTDDLDDLDQLVVVVSAAEEWVASDHLSKAGAISSVH